MQGGSANIAIRVLLEDMASSGLGGVNSQLGLLDRNARLAGGSFGIMGGVLAGMGISFALFAKVVSSAIENAAKFQTILIQMGRAGNLTQAQMQGLGNTLMNIGGSSIFSIEELGQAFVVLLQRGISAKDIMNGVGQQAVYLAEATGMKAVPAAQLLASTLVSFKLPASAAAQVVDLLQFAIEHGIGPYDTLASSISRLGGIAGTLHLTFADMVPALDVLARSTGSYSTAITGLYYYLNQVKFGTATYRDEIQKLGISFYDAKGNFIGLNESLDKLYKTLQNKSPEQAAEILGKLFNIRSGQGIAILMEQLKQVDGLTNQLKVSNDNAGVAAYRAGQAAQSAAGLWSSFKTNIQDIVTLMGGPLLSTVQKVLGSPTTGLLGFTNTIRSQMQQNPTAAATFIQLGLGYSAVGLAAAIALSPLGPFALAILATVAAVTGLALGVTWLSQHMDFFTGSFMADVEKIKAAGLAKAIQDDEAKIQWSTGQIGNLADQLAKKLAQIQQTSDPYMRSLFQSQYDALLVLQKKHDQEVIKAQQDAIDKVAAMRKTAAGQIILAEDALARDLALIHTYKDEIKADQDHIDKLYKQNLTGYSNSELAAYNHELKLALDKLHADQKALGLTQTNADKQRGIIKTSQTNMENDNQSFLDRFHTMVTTWVSNTFLPDWNKAWARVASDSFIGGQNTSLNFAAGMWSKYTDMQNPINAISQWIADHLPHSPAKQGPLRDLELQGRMIPQTIAQGMIAGTPAVVSAAGYMAGGAIPRSGGGGNQTINLVVDGKILSTVVMNYWTGVAAANGLGRSFR